MKNFFKRARGVIGLDVGSHNMRMVQVEPASEGWRLIAAANHTLPLDLPEKGEDRVNAVAEGLEHMLDSGDFTGRKVISALPCNTVHYKSLRLPRMPADELENAVAWEASDRLHISPDKMRIQYFNAGEVRQGDEVRDEIVVMAAPRDEVQEHVDAICAAGLDPIAVEADSTALARCYSYVGGEDAPVQVVLDIGHTASKVLIVRNGRTLFFKTIELGGHAMNLAVSSKMDLSIGDAMDMRRTLANPQHGEDERLFGSSRRETIERGVYDAVRSILTDIGREVQLCLRYYSVTFRGRRPETAVICGGEAPAVFASSILAEAAGLELKLGEPFDGVQGATDQRLVTDFGVGSEWSVALGLSMRSDSRAALQRHTPKPQEVAA